MDESIFLVQGVFRTPAMIITAFAERCADQGLKADQFRWRGPTEPPRFDPANPDTAIVLTVMLGTVAETVAFAWNWIQSDQSRTWSWSGIHLDRDHVIFAANGGFQPWVMFWSRVSLSAYIGISPVDAWSLRCPPGIVALLAAAQHPRRLQVIDNERWYGFWLTGLMCLISMGRSQEWFGLFLRRHPLQDRIDLDCLRISEISFDLAVPRLEFYR